MTLTEIVKARDLRALESFCLRYKYRQVREIAIKQGIDLEELEELLAEI